MTAYLPINSGPWLAAGELAATTDSTYGAYEHTPVLRTKAGYFVVGTAVDCGTFSDTGRCEHEITAAKPNGNEVEVVSRVTYRSGIWHEYTLHCTYAGGVTCDVDRETDSGSGSGSP